MQRLFSAFPNAWPGVGLLVLRIAAGIALISSRIPELRGVPHSGLVLVHIVTAFVGLSLLAGFWTPIAGALQVIVELWTLSSASRGVESGFHFLLFALGLSLVMLGPGAWSIDALLFGRKRIYIPSR